MEIWDAYNQHFERIGNMTLVRGEPIPQGVYHLVSDIIVRHTDGDYLLMQRDRRKPFGGLWEATAGGAALQGEDALGCALRELREETGIEADRLSEIGRVVSDRNQTLYVEFLCVTGCAKDSVTLQAGETSAYRWISKEELIAMGKDELVTERVQKFVEELKPETGCIIRPLRPDETDLLQEFLYQAIFVPGGAEPPAREIIETPEMRVYTEDFGTRRGDHCLVAELEGKVVGAVWTRIMDDYGHVDDETPSFAISLLKEYRNRGIGSQLMRKMLDRLQEQGFERASLSVQKANYAARMYKALGFRVVRENEEDYIMVCEL